MDDARRRAWAALGIGPVWLLRDRARAAGTPDGTDTSADADRPTQADGPTDADRPAEADIEAAAGPSSAGDVVPARAAVGPSPADAPAAEPAASAGARAEDAADAGLQDGADAPARADGTIALVRSGEPSVRRDPAIARLDWTGLGEAVAGCRACGLCEGRRNTVFGVGPRPASWMLVGEAPGEQEDLQGEPFVGPAGRLLDQMLEAIAVDRPSQAFIANVLKCRPPRNRDPLPEEVARCEPYLLRQVELLRPRLIVVLGRFAAQSLLRTDASIAGLRGRVHRYRAGDREVPMIVTYHPAYLLRNLPDKSKSWADLRLARRTWDALGGEGG